MHRKRPKEYWKFLNSLKTKKPNEQPDLYEFYEHFKNINATSNKDPENDVPLTPPDFDNDGEEILNCEITESEIRKCIRNLKNSKSPGTDDVLNEYLKCTSTLLMPLYVLLFNNILETGIMPSKWVEGIIVPIFKNKGDPLSADNYRPITLLSCIGKLFTAVLNERLTTYLDEFGLLDENQAGFRRNYSTSDHIFSLSAIIELLRAQRKKQFCAFIDFSKAFDSVWRAGLWKKLLQTNIKSKLFTVIQNMYMNIKSCVQVNNKKSQFFGSQRGVRQGENLSPVLFALFLNDLDNYLFQNGNNGITIDVNSDDYNSLIRIITLLYADDTIILAEDADSLQKALDDFAQYCKEWKLDINISKSKVVIFGSKGKQKYSFHIETEMLEIVDSYKYLGTVFAKSGSFLTARKHIAGQARKALFLSYTRINNIHLPIDL